MKIIYIFFLFLIIIFSSIIKASDFRIVMAGQIRCPYVCDGDSKYPGLLVEIVNKAFERIGRKVEVKYLPFNRAISEVRKGTINGILGVTKMKAPDLIFPEKESAVSQYRFYTKKSLPWSYYGLNSLRKINFGIIRGHSHGELGPYIERYKNQESKVRVLNDLRQLLRLLKNDRLNVILEDYIVMSYEMGKKTELATLEEAGGLAPSNIYIAFSPRKIATSTAYATNISNIITQLRKTNEFQRILKKYNIEDWKNKKFSLYKKDKISKIKIKDHKKFIFDKDEIIKIDYATSNPLGSAHVEFAQKFKVLISKYSKNKVLVKLFLNNTKGSEQDIAIQIAMGDVHMGTISVNNISTYAPVVGFMTLPYIFPKVEKAKKIFLHPIMNEINTEMIKTANFRSLSWIILGYRMIHNTMKEIRKMSDLKGLNMRVPISPLLIETWRSWGIEPIPLSWSKVYEGIKNGIIHGGGNPLNIIKSSKLFLYEKFVTKLNYNLGVAPLIINEDFYSQIPESLREVIHKAAKEAAEYEWDWINKENKQTVKWLQNKGLKINTVVNEEKWMTKARSIWPKFYDMLGGQQILEKAIKIIDSK